MARPKKPKTIYSFLIPQLRKISKWYPAITETRKRAKVFVDDGTFKNGNPKTKLMYKCEKCQAIVEKVEIDHIIPVSSFQSHGSWDNYINALFCEPSNLQAICRECHQSKTNEETTLRKEKRKKR